jgi:hypothetical protein
MSESAKNPFDDLTGIMLYVMSNDRQAGKSYPRQDGTHSSRVCGEDRHDGQFRCQDGEGRHDSHAIDGASHWLRVEGL